MNVSFSFSNFYFIFRGLVYLSIAYFACFSFEKKNHFLLRSIFSFAIYITALLVISWIGKIFNFQFTTFLKYFIMLLLGIDVLLICFDTDISNLIFIANFSFNVRHGIYLVNSFITGLVSYGTHQFYFYKDFYFYLFLFLSALLVSPFIYLFYRFCYKRPKMKTNMVTVILFSLISLVLSNVLNLFQIGVGQDDTTFQLLIIVYIFNFISLVAINFLVIYSISHYELEKEKDRIFQIQQMEAKQYQLYKENIELINIKCHDLRHQIRNLKKQDNSSLSEEVLTNLENEIRIYDTRVKSGNESLDFLLQEKSLFCNKNQIIFNCILDGKLLSFMKPSDMYSLFGNILDNAIESCLKIENVNERTITIKIHKAPGGVIVSERNPYVGEIRFSNGLPITTKEDKLYHGYGMKSIKMITSIYNGTMSIKTDNHFFALTIYFPIED